MTEKVKHIVLMVGICTVLHFLVDAMCLCCLYLMASFYSLTGLFGVFLTYNIFAFVTQPLTGWYADNAKKPHWLLLFSILLLVAAVFIAVLAVALFEAPSPYVMMVVAILLGMGNSIFHTWGGKQTVLKAGNDPQALGVFVSTGAFGLAVGAYWCSWMLLLAMLVLASLLALTYMRHDTTAKIHDFKTASLSGMGYGVVVVTLLALMSFVMFRSYIGESFASGTNKGGVVILAFGAISMLGKMSGGWIARQFGVVRSFVFLLLAFFVCFTIRGKGMSVILLGLFLINCTMPITLYWANAVLRGREGLAFGLLAAALIPGFLLAYL